jgi:hypothetical protein
MVKVLALAGVVALLPAAAPAQPGNSSSWGTVGWGPGIPTRALSPKDRSLELQPSGDVPSRRQRRMASPTWEGSVSLLSLTKRRAFLSLSRFDEPRGEAAKDTSEINRYELV